ncbi:MAG: hypothetical protein LBB76_08055 [Azoarcus sp.]|nr:hypothetical protein [Azoarcus sp.]
MRKHAEILADWAPDLSLKLGRPVEVIRGKGLSAYDFPPSQRVRINFVDGSVAEFNYAFACIREKESQVAVFTEHCGYLEFWLEPEMEIVEIRENHYRHE